MVIGIAKKVLQYTTVPMLAVFLIGYSLCTAASEQRSVPPINFREDGTKVHVAGKNYLIRRGYLEHPVDPMDFLIGADWPTMTLPDRTPAGLETYLLILVSDASVFTTVKFRLNAARGVIYGPIVYKGKRFGLSYYLSSKPDPITQNFAEKYREQIFVDMPSEDFFMTCDGDLRVPSPGCTETFAADGLLFEVTFRKTHIKEWKAIKQAAISSYKASA